MSAARIDRLPSRRHPREGAQLPPDTRPELADPCGGTLPLSFRHLVRQEGVRPIREARRRCPRPAPPERSCLSWAESRNGDRQIPGRADESRGTTAGATGRAALAVARRLRPATAQSDGRAESILRTDARPKETPCPPRSARSSSPPTSTGCSPSTPTCSAPRSSCASPRTVRSSTSVWRWATRSSACPPTPSVVAGDPGRMLLSIEVPDVDALLPRVEELGGTGGERRQRHALGSAGRPHQGPGRQRRQPDPDAVIRAAGSFVTPRVSPGRSRVAAPHERAPPRPVRHARRRDGPSDQPRHAAGRGRSGADGGARRLRGGRGDKERGKAVKPGN